MTKFIKFVKIIWWNNLDIQKFMLVIYSLVGKNLSHNPEVRSSQAGAKIFSALNLSTPRSII